MYTQKFDVHLDLGFYAFAYQDDTLYLVMVQDNSEVAFACEI
jgi:hypothetical protein